MREQGWHSPVATRSAATPDGTVSSATQTPPLPISWRGTLAQYAGRLHRLHAAKREVIIYDYVDQEEPMLAKMAGKRRFSPARLADQKRS